MKGVNICVVAFVIIIILLINFWVYIEWRHGSTGHSRKHHHKSKGYPEKFPSEPVVPIEPVEVSTAAEPKPTTVSDHHETRRKEQEKEILKELDRLREREKERERQRLEEHQKNHHHHRIHQHSHHGQQNNHTHHHHHNHSVQITTTTEKIETTTRHRGIVKDILEEINRNQNHHPTRYPTHPPPTTTTPSTTTSTTAHHIHHAKHGDHELNTYVPEHGRNRHNHTIHYHNKHHENRPEYHEPRSQSDRAEEFTTRNPVPYEVSRKNDGFHNQHQSSKRPVVPEQHETTVNTVYRERYPELPRLEPHETTEHYHHRTTNQHYQPTTAPTTPIIRTTIERIRVTPPPRRPFNPATFVPRIEVYRSDIRKNTDGAVIFDITSTTTEKSIHIPVVPSIPDRNDVDEWVETLDDEELEESTRAPDIVEATTERQKIPLETTTLHTSTHYSTTAASSEEDFYGEEFTTISRTQDILETSTIPSPPKIEVTTKKSSEDEVTIVTAMIDIGRGDWWEYRRPLEKYHEFMENLLSLKNYMVIFTDLSSIEFVRKYRKNMGLIDKTKIHLITIDNLPLSRHLPYAQKIIEDELKNEQLYQHDPSMKNHPEAKSAEYDIVVNSKTYFLHNATLEDPFGSEFFVWIDAGYGHGNASVFPYDAHWKPVFPHGKISMIKLTPPHDPIKGYRIDNLYRRNWSVVSGGFIAGDKRTLGQLYTIVTNKFIHLIYQNKVDDDQTVMVLAINSYPHLFNIQHGDWFDAFRLFSSNPELQFG